MTVAVCWKCGAMKWGAFNPCPQCKAEPRSEDDRATSMGMSDHYFDKPTLERMGADIAAGKPVILDPETCRNLINAFRQHGSQMPAMQGVAKAADIDCQPPLKKTWWQKLVSLYTITPAIPKWHIGLHSSVQHNVALASAWTAYAGTITLVRDGTYPEKYPDTRGQTSPFDEEYFARDTLAEFWATQTVTEQATDPYLQLLVKVREAGLLREYVWRFLRKPHWPAAAGMNLEPLEAWLAREGIVGHRAVTRAMVMPWEEAQCLMRVES